MKEGIATSNAVKDFLVFQHTRNTINLYKTLSKVEVNIKKD